MQLQDLENKAKAAIAKRRLEKRRALAGDAREDGSGASSSQSPVAGQPWPYQDEAQQLAGCCFVAFDPSSLGPCHAENHCEQYHKAPMALVPISMSLPCPMSRGSYSFDPESPCTSSPQSSEPFSSPGGRYKLRTLPPGTTTLVIRNIPARYSRDKLVSEWESERDINFIFLPFDATLRRTTGCAYVNFSTHEGTLDFQRRLQGSFLLNHGAGKHLDVAAATLQGLEANLRQFTGKQLPCESRLPAVFEGTWRLTSQQVANAIAALATRTPSHGSSRRASGLASRLWSDE